MMTVHRILLLLLSAGKGGPAIALNGGRVPLEHAGPGLCVCVGTSECVFWEQPVLLISIYEHTRLFK